VLDAVHGDDKCKSGKGRGASFLHVLRKISASVENFARYFHSNNKKKDKFSTIREQLHNEIIRGHSLDGDKYSLKNVLGLFGHLSIL
jgi:hypothetical protein